MGEYDLSLKVILLGDCGVGKTRLIKELSKKRSSTVGTCCCYSFTPNSNVDLEFKRHGKRISLKIMDTGGQEKYRSMTNSYFRGCEGCLLMFNVTRVDSFEHLLSWYESLQEYCPSRYFTTVMMGVRSEDSGNCIPEDRIQKMAQHLNTPYYELDLRSHENIINCLEDIVDIMARKFLNIKSADVELSKDSIELHKDNPCSKKCLC